MIIENTFDKLKLISELKEIHIELVEVYKKIFDYKYRTNADFEAFIDKEYKENKISDGEQQVWNDNFCHRASYTLLNKILFIRICEDKGFMLNPEDYVAGEPKDPHIGKKLSRIGLQKWANLVTNYTLGELVKLAFLDMKKSYGNIALYKDDKYEMLTPTTEELSLKYLDGDEEAQKLVLQFENALSNIVEKLDTNNYNFNNTDGNILGDVYEKFMNRETRKAIGQFYTPEFVIEYILKNTVAEADVVENPFASVADISCGSGHFLIMAYDILREKFINSLELLKDKYADEVYTLKKNGKVEELTGKDYWKEENIHYHLLKHCIYGADIDSFAVQLTTINLLLKDLDNFTDELNIVECDSLIKWEEDYDWKDLREQLKEEFETKVITQTNLFGEIESFEITQKKEDFLLKLKKENELQDTQLINIEKAQEIIMLSEFWNNKFDIIVGNPPYIEFKKLRNEYKNYYNNNYYSAVGKYDIYVVFIERAINLLKESGNLGYICPTMFIKRDYGKNIKEFIANNIYLKNILDFSDKQVFNDATTYTGIFMMSKVKNANFQYIKLIEDFNIDELESYKYEQIEESLLKYSKVKNIIINEKCDDWNFVLMDENNFLKKIEDKKIMTLEKVTTQIFQGISSGKDEVFYLTKKEVEENKLEKEIVFKLCKGKDVDEYYQKNLKYNVIYPYIIDGSGNQEVIKEGILRSDYPNVYNYLLKNKSNLSGRGYFENSNKNWYELWCQRDKESFLSEKILVPEISIKNKFFYDTESSFFNTKVYGIILKEEYVKEIGYYCLLGYLNSNIVNYYYKKNTVPKAGGYYVYKTQFLNNIPIPNFDEQSKKLIGRCAKKIQENLVTINKRYKLSSNLSKKEDILLNYMTYINNRCILERENEILKLTINKVCYEIFGFTISEIELLESSDEVAYEDGIEYKLILSNNYKPLSENQMKEVLGELESQIKPTDLIYMHSVNGLNMDIKTIAEKYNCRYSTLTLLREKYLQKYSNLDEWKFYNLTELYETINFEIKERCILIFKMKSEALNPLQLLDSLKVLFEKFEQLIEILRIDNHNKKSLELVKQAVNEDSFTWNAYRKVKSKGKVDKVFIKYDGNNYGLAEWPDEIHKNYFLDAIEEYTVNNPNEKKAKDVLKLFKDLDIEDKQDYIEVIEEKIRKTFK